MCECLSVYVSSDRPRFSGLRELYCPKKAEASCVSWLIKQANSHPFYALNGYVYMLCGVWRRAAPLPIIITSSLDQSREKRETGSSPTVNCPITRIYDANDNHLAFFVCLCVKQFNVKRGRGDRGQTRKARRRNIKDSKS